MSQPYKANTLTRNTNTHTNHIHTHKHQIENTYSSYKKNTLKPLTQT